MKRKILIVEDEPIVALDLHEEIEQLGCDVVGIAESAEQAMAIAEIYRPDLALMDINIIGCMDGIQTAHLLYSAYRIPSVFLTSYHDHATMERAVKDLTYGYLTKPYASHQLKAALMVALNLIEADEAEQGEQIHVVAAVSAMREGLMTVTLQRTVEFMNAAAERMTGALPREARGKHISEVLKLAEGFPVDAAGMVLLGHFSEMEGVGWTHVHAGDAPLKVNVAISPMIDNAGVVTGHVVRFRSATELTVAQAIAGSFS
jgi:two-component system cell cycle sensor histidine kinase/response regulator CckA